MLVIFWLLFSVFSPFKISPVFAVAEYPAIESVAGMPEEHIYKNLDFGPNSINEQRVQLKSNAPNGAPITASQLNINNAGVQAAFIAPVSHPISAGEICNSIDLGKIAQELAGEEIITSQLQCMYNPTFCDGLGYCFLPIRTSSLIYQFSYLQYSAACPVGTIVDTIQPSSGIYTEVSCPALYGWTITQGVHGEAFGCYDSVTGFSWCTAYQSVCSYKNQSGNVQKVQVLGLAQLQCTNASATYVVDNYAP